MKIQIHRFADAPTELRDAFLPKRPHWIAIVPDGEALDVNWDPSRMLAARTEDGKVLVGGYDPKRAAELPNPNPSGQEPPAGPEGEVSTFVHG